MPSTSPYDLVVFDVLHPWHPAGTAFLYTVEAFRIGKARLGPAGRVVVWLPLYQICAGRALLTPWSRPGLMTRMSEAYRARDPFDLVGTVLADRFRIEKEIAEGGFGVVYLATQVALDRPVAIKVLKTPPGLDEKARGQFREKFAAEAKTIARLKHAHIVDVYDFGISALPAGSLAPWMALEWLEGDTLEVILGAIRGTDGMTAKATLSLLRPVLQAFGYAHRQGIAHRDIKPANVMMSMADHGSVLRVLDFGIAKIMNPDDSAGSGLTRTAGLPAFSPAYAAPEQVAFGRTGPWTDVHALGLMLTEAVTGQLPFAGQDMQLYEQIMGVERPTPAAKGKNVGAWEPVLAKALALQPTQRWKDADDLLAALEATVDDADVEMHLALDDTAHAAPGGAPAPAASSAAISATGRSRRTRLVTLAALGAVVAGAAAVAVTRWASRPAGPGVEQRATLPPPAPEPAAAPKTSPETAPAHPDPSPPPATAAAAPPRADENAIAPPKDAARGDIKRSKRNKRDNKTVSRSIEVE